MTEDHVRLLQLGVAYIAASPFVALIGWRSVFRGLYIAGAAVLAIIGTILAVGQVARYA